MGNVFAPTVTEEGDATRVTFVGKMVSANTLSAQLGPSARSTPALQGEREGLRRGLHALYVNIVDYIIASQVAPSSSPGAHLRAHALWMRLSAWPASASWPACPIGMMLSAMVALDRPWMSRARPARRSSWA